MSRRIRMMDRRAAEAPAMPGYDLELDHPASSEDPDEDLYMNGTFSSWAEDIHPGPYRNAPPPRIPTTPEGNNHPAADPENLRVAVEHKARKAVRVAQAMLPGASLKAIEDQALSMMDWNDDQLDATLFRMASADDGHDVEDDDDDMGMFFDDFGMDDDDEDDDDMGMFFDDFGMDDDDDDDDDMGMWFDDFGMDDDDEDDDDMGMWFDDFGMDDDDEDDDDDMGMWFDDFGMDDEDDDDEDDDDDDMGMWFDDSDNVRLASEDRALLNDMLREASAGEGHYVDMSPSADPMSLFDQGAGAGVRTASAQGGITQSQVDELFQDDPYVRASRQTLAAAGNTAAQQVVPPAPMPRTASAGPSHLGHVPMENRSMVDELSALWDAPPDVSSHFNRKM